MLTDKTLKHLTPKDTILEVYEKMGGQKAMVDWAKSNPSTFYVNLYGKLVSPTFELGEGNKLVIELPWLTSRPGPVRIIEGESVKLPQTPAVKGKGKR